jgi:uncharacterized protein
VGPAVARVGARPRRTPHADWLIAIFDHWYSVPSTRVRLFQQITQLLLGGTAESGDRRSVPGRRAVIETDGAIEQPDFAQGGVRRAAATGLHLRHDPLDAVLLLSTVAGRQLDVQSLARRCWACRVRQVCGGDLSAHRSRPGIGFAYPSVYCPDRRQLIGHVRAHKPTAMPGSPAPPAQ